MPKKSLKLEDDDKEEEDEEEEQPQMENINKMIYDNLDNVRIKIHKYICLILHLL